MNNALFLDDWTVDAVEKPDRKTYRIKARYDTLPDACPKCGSVGRLYKWATIPTEYLDAPVHGRRTIIVVEKQRLRCRECGATFMQPLPDMDPKRSLTKRAVEYIAEQALYDTNLSVARTLGVQEKTVRQIVDEANAEREANHRISGPLILGIDELVLQGEPRAILIDVGHGRILDILPDRTIGLVHRWLSWLPDRERVHIVTTDMWNPYREATYAALPNAVIVADKWHVQKKIGEAVDKVRNRLARNLSRAQRRKALRGRRLLLTHRGRLSPRAAFVLDGWLKNNPVLNDAWEMKEMLYGLWDAPDRANAEALFAEMKESIRPSVAEEFGEFCRTIDNWYAEVFAYFDHRQTNATTEALNGVVKIANRAGRGYHFKQIRARALFAPRRANPVMVCEECLGRFDPQHLPMLTVGWHPRICPTCMAFNVPGWVKPHGRSTPKSE
ncbi:ISL3 family transposase [Methylobacterium fujisawaense]|uniref:ISL3 family transposase n=2 Tax=Bacteria TaxID=2 RepID=UPI003701E676